jgi:glycosyltransferase involved in cell wall biosynthesis
MAVVPYNKEDWEKLSRLGMDIVALPIVDQRLSPLSDLRMTFFLYRLFRKVRPGLVFSFTSKPVIFGSLAARVAGVRTIASMIPGLGFVYSRHDARAAILRLVLNQLYRFALPTNDLVYFQNEDDLDFFTSQIRCVNTQNAVLINGSGVDLNEFRLKDAPQPNRHVTFVCSARLIREKGIEEYVRAATATRAIAPNSRFTLIATADNSPGGISSLELETMLNETPVEHISSESDMARALRGADVFVLPTYYREGVPRVILEAMASGCAIVTTDTPGSRNTVAHGINGYLVAPRDVQALQDAMIALAKSPDLCWTMGRESRRRAESTYDVRQITARIMSSLTPLLASPRPKLLYAVTNADLAGAPMHVLALAAAFCKVFEVHCIVGSSGPVADSMRELGIDVRVIPGLRSEINLLSDLAVLRRILQTIRTLNPDLIHAHSSKAGFIARLAGILTHTPTIFTAHGWGFAPGTSVHQKLLVWIAEAISVVMSRAIICVSKYDASLAKRWLPLSSSKVHTIHNGVPDSPVRTDPRRESVTFTMIARVSAQKDHGLAIRAFSKISAERTSFQFVGEGTQSPHFRSKIDKLPPAVSSKITCLGPRRDVGNVISNSQVFVLLSRHEGLPLTILEAMSAGLPIIASDVGGVAELVINEHNGFLVPRGDEAAAARAMQVLADNPDLREAMGNRSRERYLKHFRDDQMIAAVGKVYEQILRPAFA